VGVKRLGTLTTNETHSFVQSPKMVVVLLPVGSVEPHGPHLPLNTDTTISVSAAERAAVELETHGHLVLLAPPIPYGVTECAAGFAGAVSVSANALSQYIHSVIEGMLATGFDHVCVINNHLEPDHDLAVRSSIAGLPAGAASVACPLSRRWARTLTAEFKSGECHAGQYETSIMMAADSDSVRNDIRESLQSVPVSLSKQLTDGVTRFKDMGLDQAYSGYPSDATAVEGHETLDKLAAMIITEVKEALATKAAN
jgi:creatinine amidohydrolase